MAAFPVLEATSEWVGHGWWPWVAPLWILLWVVVLWTAVRFLFRRGGRGWCGPQAARERSADAILGERFARGEIDADEYQSRLKTLRQ